MILQDGAINKENLKKMNRSDNNLFYTLFQVY